MQLINKNKLSDNVLVHTCCAPCAAYCFESLEEKGYKITGYFYNPNIHPESEYNKRLEELKRYCGEKGFELILEEDPPEKWFNKIKGYEQEKERGKRCEICFYMRLEKTALYAVNKGFNAFATVLTISPHKNSFIINETGKKIAKKYNIKFIEENFKKHDGFKKSIEISEKYGFYRQNYCGCVYSFR